jgi:hypothetical protein
VLAFATKIPHHSHGEFPPLGEFLMVGTAKLDVQKKLPVPPLIATSFSSWRLTICTFQGLDKNMQFIWDMVPTNG